MNLRRKFYGVKSDVMWTAHYVNHFQATFRKLNSSGTETIWSLHLK